MRVCYLTILSVLLVCTCVRAPLLAQADSSAEAADWLLQLGIGGYKTTLPDGSPDYLSGELSTGVNVGVLRRWYVSERTALRLGGGITTLTITQRSIVDQAECLTRNPSCTGPLPPPVNAEVDLIMLSIPLEAEFRLRRFGLGGLLFVPAYSLHVPIVTKTSGRSGPFPTQGDDRNVPAGDVVVSSPLSQLSLGIGFEGADRQGKAVYSMTLGPTVYLGQVLKETELIGPLGRQNYLRPAGALGIEYRTNIYF